MARQTSYANTRRRFPHAERRELILDVAEHLFVADGYAAVTMEDIARESGVSRPVVYNHFETREGVYLACVERARAQYEAELLGQLDSQASPRDRLAAGGEVFFRMLERDPGRWLLLFGGNSVLPSTHADQLSELRFKTIDAIAELLRRSRPEAPSELMDVYAQAVSGVGERLGHWWLRNPQISRQQLVDYYTDFLWAGMRQTAEAEL